MENKEKTIEKKCKNCMYHILFRETTPYCVLLTSSRNDEDSCEHFTKRTPK